MKDNQPRHPYCDRKSPGIRIFLRKHCGMFASRKSGLHPLAPSSDQPSPRGKNHVWRSRKMKSIAGCIFAQSRPQSATNDIAAAAFGRKLQLKDDRFRPKAVIHAPLHLSQSSRIGLDETSQKSGNRYLRNFGYPTRLKCSKN